MRKNSVRNNYESFMASIVILVMVIGQFSCEWVEISQQKFKKPTKITRFQPSLEVTDKASPLDTIYENQTIWGRQWNKGVIDRNTNMGYVIKIQNLTQTPVILTPDNKDEKFNLGDEKLKVLSDASDKKTLIHGSSEDLFMLNDNSVGLQNYSNKMKNQFSEINKVNEIKTSTAIIAEDLKYKRVVSLGKVENSTVISPTTSLRRGNQDDKESKKKLKNTITRSKEEFVTEHVKKKNLIQDTTETKLSAKKEEQIFETHEEVYKNYQNKLKAQEHTDILVEDKVKESLTNHKTDVFENLKKFLKNIVESITVNTQKSFQSKVRYLERLKETILENIETRIDIIWPDDELEKTKSTSSRQKRSARVNQRGHLEYPSTESALMTISFLTFAVFLIKLVLQVIQTYKSKPMMIAPGVVTAYN